MVPSRAFCELGGPRRPLSAHRRLFVLSGRRRRPGDPETSIYVAASDTTAAARSASTSLPPRPHFQPGINPSRRSPRPRSTLPRQTRPPRPDQSRRSTRPRRIFRLYRLCLFDRPSFTTIGTTPTNGRVLAFRGRIIVTIGPGCALSYVRLQGGATGRRSAGLLVCQGIGPGAHGPPVWRNMGQDNGLHNGRTPDGLVMPAVQGMPGVLIVLALTVGPNN